jgi:antitoxin component of RelBE/YafQ-DinJ toxin-antitoxin module
MEGGMQDKRVALNMRLDPVTEAVIDALGEKLGLNRSAVVRMAVRRVAEMEGVEIPRLAREGKAAA